MEKPDFQVMVLKLFTSILWGSLDKLNHTHGKQCNICSVGGAEFLGIPKESQIKQSSNNEGSVGLPLPSVAVIEQGKSIHEMSLVLPSKKAHGNSPLNSNLIDRVSLHLIFSYYVFRSVKLNHAYFN